MLSPEAHLIIAHLFPRLLGVIYFFALAPFIFQIRGLIGENGILPVSLYLKHFRHMSKLKRYYWLPTIFWWTHSDRALVAASAVGSVLAVLLACGVYPIVLIPILFFIHLSIVTVGQDFLSFGWEMFFLEISFNAFFLSLTTVPNIAIWISLYLLLFRFHIQAGSSKFLSREKVWRNLTALNYHYQTQPLPNTIAWYFHKLPVPFHKFSVIMMLVIEIILPFAMLGPQSFQLAAFIGFFLLQYFIWVSGNYSYLNYLTVVLSTLLISDIYLAPVFSVPEAQSSPLILDLFLYAIGCCLIGLQLLRLLHHFLPRRGIANILTYVQPFHIANRYGIFAIMTTTRYEIIVEGSDNGQEWKEYYFRYKPSEINRRPRRIAPYQPRLDWQAWFLPFEEFGSAVWFQNFLFRLLQGSPHVLSLLRLNPFPDKPPQYIRAKIYIYEFSDVKSKKLKGEWWRRKFIDAYTPILGINEK